MNDTKFTVGPWRKPDDWGICSDCDDLIVVVSYDLQMDERHHNLNLIAVAPNMYDELVESLETFKAIYELTQSYGAKKSIDRIEKLLAKARGEHD